MHLLAFAEVVQLFPDGTLFIHIAIILGMIWVLNRTLYRPINRVLESRERNKGGHSSEAVEILKDVDLKSAAYNKEMLDARNTGYDLVAKELQKTSEAKAKKLETAKAEIAARYDAEKADLEKQKAEARDAIGTEAEKVAEEIATNILGA